MKRKEKLIGLFMVLFTMISLNAFAGNDAARYGKVIATSSGNGKVYVSTSNSTFGASWQDSESTATCDNKQLMGNGYDNTYNAKTYYFHAQANAEYKFVGWYENSDYSGEAKIDNPLEVKFTLGSGTTQDNPTTVQRYAKFEQIALHYSKVIARTESEEKGLVYVATTNTNPSDADYAATKEASTQERKENQTYTYYLRARANTGYAFEGWYKNGEKIGDNNSQTVSIKGTTDPNNSDTYEARFVYSTYYSKVSVATDGEGSAAVFSKTVSSPTYSDENKSNTQSSQVAPNSIPNHTYYLYAEAGEGVVFKGWKEGNDIVSYANPYEMTVTPTTTTATKTLTAVFGEPNSNWTWGEAPAAGQYYIYSPINKVYIKATSTVTTERDDATLFTLSGSSNFTIAYDDNGSTKYVYEGSGNANWGTTNTNKWSVSKQSGGYYISHTDPEYWTTRTRYIQVSATGIDYPRNNYVGNNRLLIFISPAEIPAEAAYTTAWTAANALTADQKANLSPEASAQLTEYLTKPTDITNATEVTAILKALCKAAEGETRSTASDKYGTICLPYAFTATGATVYSVSEYNKENSTLSLTVVENPAAGVPYIYKATDSSQRFDMNGGECVAGPVGDAYLVGLLGNLQVPNYNYVLQTKDGVQGFYQLQLPNLDDFATSTEYRCYLKNNNDFTSEAKAISFSIKETTDINSISQQETTVGKSIYTVNGVKVSSLQKGMNIIKMTDGSVKKVMVK